MRARRWLAPVLALLLVPALVVGWFIAGLIGAAIPGQSRDWPGEATVGIRLAFTPIHTDLLLPIDDDLRARFAFADSAGVGILHPEARWLLVGWGARDYYTAQTVDSALPIGVILRAIGGDSSVIRLEAWFDFVPDDYPNIRVMHLTEGGYAALLDRIEAEIGTPELVMAPGLSQIDAFYAAKSPFSPLQTCNSWVGEALREAGVPLGRWTPTLQAMELSLALYGP